MVAPELTQSCAEKIRLLDDWSAKSYKHRCAVRKAIAAFDGPDYEKLRLEAQRAREESQQAEAAFNHHLSEHGC